MKSKQFIIAIGASAGGMEQINTFFDYTPLDGVSYIIIQHLSADYKSMMALLLAKHSKLVVIEAENNMTVEVNKVYLIPSKSVMTITDGRLMLVDKAKGLNLTINVFFKSLALERGSRAIGVILSGTGSDGTEGMTAIKNAGGMLITSDSDSAEFDQMPESAAATGLVDHVVSPVEMPRIIRDYVENRAGEPEQGINEDDEKIMTAIVKLIREKLPEDFSGYKTNTILRRIKRRASLLKLPDLEAYLKLLKNDTAELQSLVKDFLISVTTFFRDKAAFSMFEKKVFPDLLHKTKDEEIKIWIAGCATGEEAYSFAIMIREQLDALGKKNVVKIFATDIDDYALRFAGRAQYGKNIEKDVSVKRLKAFFISNEKGFRINSSIREMLIFAHHDLVKNPPYCNMDIISCRNLLIYLTLPLQRKVLSMLHFGLKFEGYLFLGPSENVSDFSTSLEEIDKKWKIYRNIQAKRQLNFESLIFPSINGGQVGDKHEIEPTVLPVKKPDTSGTIEAGLLVEMGLIVIWVNEGNMVLHVLGDSGRFLLPKLFTHHFPELLSKPLQVAFTTGANKADHDKRSVSVKGIKVDKPDRPLTLLVGHLHKGVDGVLKRIILIGEEDNFSFTKEALELNENFYTNKYTVNLEEELQVVKEKLAASNDLLNASNENMQSFNEELLSANEEMQSTNEEMQSVNEELQTINTEYQFKIRELSDLNDDLNNYFRSNVNGQVFVNKDLLLMKFSPGAAIFINLLESDIGRPLSNISTNIKFETIDTDIRTVLADGGVITREIQGVNDKWFQVMTMPYLRNGNAKPDGAIITFNDISELKKIQHELSLSNKSLKTINSDLDNFVYTASHDLLSPINNIEQIIHLIREKENGIDAEGIDYLDMLSSSVKKFRRVIKEMASIGDLESEVFKVESVNLAKIIDDVIGSIHWKISAEKANIKIDLDVKKITFSKKNCRSMIHNLVNNALKFKSPDRPAEIMISTKNLPEFVVLTVKDNGIGFEENKIQSIFKMYKRLNADAEGQGLGLFLINKIMDASGGRVEVDSQPGIGTEFRLYIRKPETARR